MKFLYFPLIALLSLSQSNLLGQRSFYENSNLKQWDRIAEFNDHKLYGLVLNSTENIGESFYDPIKTSKSSYYLNETRSLDLLLEQYIFITDIRLKAEYECLIALKYFDKGELENVILWSEKVDKELLTPLLFDQLNFKTGYAHLVNRNFETAYHYFNNTNKVYPIPNEYYLAMSNYYLNDLNAAIIGFQKVDNEWPYSEYVPYYLTQIYFSKKEFEQTDSYGTNAIKRSASENKAQLYKLVGLANFELKNFNKANDYLGKYADESESLTKEEFYQIAYSQYQLDKHEESIRNFKEISNLSDTIGTLSNYYIADMYLQRNDLKAAQTAFSKLADISQIKDLKEDAEYNYTLLSVELGDERLALNAIKKMPKAHRHYDKSNQLLLKLLKETKDYTAAMGFIEDLEFKNEEILEVYQELSYKQAILHFNDNTPLKSLSYFSIAAETPGMAKVSAEAIFWQAYIHYKKGNASRSNSFLTKYFSFVDQHKEVSSDIVYAKAKYLQGYLYWDKEDYKNAFLNFESCLNNQNGLDLEKISDASTRTGDYYLLQNNYEKANKQYLSALRNNNNNDYAAYQLGIVAGLQSDPIDKIIILEEFLENYHESNYRDNSLLEIGNAYFSLGKKNNAIQSFDLFLNEFGFTSELSKQVLLKKGLISYNSGSTQEAIKSYKKVLELGPTAEEQKQALTALEEIFISELNDPESYFKIAEDQGGLVIDDFTKDSISYAIAYELFKNGEYVNAINNFEKYRSNFQNGFYFTASLYYQGEANSLEKNYTKAVLNYEEIIRLKNNEFYPRALKKAALIKYNQEQDYKKAFEYYDILIFELGIDELDFITSGLICANLSNYESSVIKYANKLIGNNNATKDQKAIAYFYLGKALLNKDENTEALLALQKVVEMSSNNKAAEAGYLISKVFFERGEFEKAETHALETSKRAQQYPYWVAKSLLLLGDVYINNKDVYNARAVIEALLENYTSDPEIVDEANEKFNLIKELEIESNRIKEKENNQQIQLDTLTIDNK